MVRSIVASRAGRVFASTAVRVLRSCKRYGVLCMSILFVGHRERFPDHEGVGGQGWGGLQVSCRAECSVKLPHHPEGTRGHPRGVYLLCVWCASGMSLPSRDCCATLDPQVCCTLACSPCTPWQFCRLPSRALMAGEEGVGGGRGGQIPVVAGIVKLIGRGDSRSSWYRETDWPRRWAASRSGSRRP